MKQRQQKRFDLGNKIARAVSDDIDLKYASGTAQKLTKIPATFAKDTAKTF